MIKINEFFDSSVSPNFAHNLCDFNILFVAYTFGAILHILLSCILFRFQKYPAPFITLIFDSESLNSHTGPITFLSP